MAVSAMVIGLFSIGVFFVPLCIKKGAMPKFHRYFGISILSFMGRIIYGVKIGNFHCGLRGFSKEAVLILNLKSEGMEFDTEIIGAFSKKNFKIIEIPTVLNKDLRNGRSHLRSFRDGFRHLVLMLKTAFK